MAIIKSFSIRKLRQQKYDEQNVTEAAQLGYNVVIGYKTSYLHQ